MFALEWYFNQILKLVKNNPLMVQRLFAAFAYESVTYNPTSTAAYRNRRRARRRAV